MIGTSYKTFMLIILFVSAILIGYVSESQAQINLKLINPATSGSDFQVSPQDVFDLQVRVDTAGQEVNAFSVYLSYDDSVLQVIDQDSSSDGIQPFIQGDFLEGAILENDTHDDPGNSIDKFQLDYTEVLLVGKKKGEGLVATVQFKAIAEGNTTISFDFDSANARDTAVSIPPGVTTPDVITATIEVSQGGSSGEEKEFTKISGDNQTGVVNTELAEPFVVMVSKDGNPLSGEQVTFEVMQGGGSFGGETSVVATANAEGKAQVIFKLGNAPTVNTVKATLKDFTGEPLTFTATAMPEERPEYELAIKSGDNQTGIVGYTLSNPLVVKVMRFENPAADVNVLFEVIEGDGKLNGGETNYTAVTIANGEATTNLALGQTAGTLSVKASLEGLEATPVTFTALAQPGPPNKIVEVSGNNQKGPVESTLPDPLVVAVFDEFDNPIHEHNVTFQIIEGAGNLDGSQRQTKSTDSDGKVSVNLTLGNIVGEDSNVVHAVTDPPLAGSPIIFKASAVPVATRIRLILGNNQTGRISEPLANPFVVKVEDDSGYAVPNTSVTFQVVQGGGSMDSTSVLTDETGEARATLTLGDEVGQQNNSVEASIPNGQKVTFVANAISGQPASIEIFSGDNQTCELESQLSNPLVVKVTDSVGNAVEKTPVTFRLTAGDGLLIPKDGQSEENGGSGVALSRTDALGEAYIYFKAKTKAGNATVQASLEDEQSVEFNVKVNPGEPDTVSEFSGNGQTNTVGKQLLDPFVVIVRDKYANPVSGVPVSFAIKSGAKNLSVEEMNTDEAGKASTFLTLGEKAGKDKCVVEAYATRGEGDNAIHLSGAPVIFTASATPDEAVELEIVSGNSQIGLVGEPLPLPLVVRALDQFQNPVDEVAIAFFVTEGGGSLGLADSERSGEVVSESHAATVTDANGESSTVLTLGQNARTPKLPDAGRNQVKASIAGSEDIHVDFTADGIPGSPHSLKKISGDGQTGIVTNVLPKPFVVEITDKFGNPITKEKPNRPPVTFTVISGGGMFSSGNDSVTLQLNDDGRTSSFLTLGEEVGDNIVQVTADVPDGSPVQFRATALESGMVSLSKSDGDNQTGAVGAKLSGPLEVIAKDSLNQPISGQVIEYRFERGDGTFTDGSRIYETSTDSEGKARATPILGANTGVQEIRAYSPQHPEVAVLFTVTAVHGEPTNLTIASGDEQTAPVMTRLPQPLTVKLTDAYSHPIPNARIIFEVVSGDGEIQVSSGNSPAKSIPLSTNDEGEAAVLFTLGNVAGAYNHRVKASLEDNGALSLIFKASALNGQPVMLEKTSGDGQTGLVEATLSLPLIVTLKDEWHNPVPSRQINFEVIEGGGTVRKDATSQPPARGEVSFQKEITIQTDNRGQASVLFALGSEVGKNNNVVRATAVGIPIEPVEFKASALPDVLDMTLTKVTEEPLSGIVGQPLMYPLTVLLQDRLGNPVSTTEILFEVTAGGGLLTAPAQNEVEGQNGSSGGNTTAGTPTLRLHTDISGKASAILILGERAGVENNIVTVSSPQFDLSDEFKASAKPGEPVKLEKISGDNQNGIAAQPLSQPLVVGVKDEFGNPVPDYQVQFTVKVGDGKLGTEKVSTLSVKTGEDGWAKTVFRVGTMAGDNNNAVEVTMSSSSAAVVSFIASTLPDEVAKYNLTSGDGQVGVAGEPLEHPFVVTVTDKYDNPISDVTVIFEVTAGDGKLIDRGPQARTPAQAEQADKLSVITDEQGQASVTLILGPAAMNGPSSQGNNLVRVTVPDIPDYPRLYFFALAKAATGAKLVKISGDNQTGTVGEPLQNPLVVGVFDSLGNPAPDTPVIFEIAKGGGRISFGNVNSKRSLETRTDLNGRVAVSLTLGTMAGVDSNEVLAGLSRAATISGQQPIRFTVSSQADAPDELIKTSGDDQIGTPGLPLPEPFVVTSLDRFNNPIVNATVTFKVTKGGGLLRPANGIYATESVNVATDDKGMAAVYLVLPSRILSDSLVEVSLPAFANIPPVTFKASAQAKAVASLQIISGDGQHGTAGKMLPEPLIVFASDQFGNPVEGELVDFEVIENNGILIPDNTRRLTAYGSSIPNDSESTLKKASINTDSTGRAAVRWLLGTKADEPNRLKATLRELKLARVFTATAFPSAATSLLIESGASQTGTVGEPLPSPMVVRVDDQFGNPVANASVIFEVIAGDGKLMADRQTTSLPYSDGSKSISALTDVNGQAKAYLVLGEKAGVNNNAVSVTPMGFSSPPVTFLASSVASVAYYLKKQSGDQQVTTVSTPLNEPVVVEVTDRFGNPVEGALVDFVLVSGDGLLSATSPINQEQGKITIETDANGQASVIWTLGPKAGLSELIARCDGLINSPLPFTATAKAGGQVKLVKISGDKQIGIVGQELSRPLIVAVVDAKNNPIENAEVYFEVVEGLGSLIGGDCLIASPNHRICRAITDAQGRASIRLILGHKSGQENNIVEAMVVAAPGMLEGDVDKKYFKITAEADQPAKLVKLKGDEQRGIAGATLFEPLVAIALDKYNNPVEDVIITFKALDNPPGSGKNKGKLMLNLGGGNPQHSGRIAVDILDVYTDNEGKAAAFYELPRLFGGSTPKQQPGENALAPSRVRAYSPTLPINQLEFIEYPDTPPSVEFSSNSRYYGTNVVSFEMLENDFLEFTAKAMDKDKDEVTISVEDLPANSSFTPDERGTSGKFRWRPSHTQAGSYQIAFTATDKLGSSIHAVANIIVHNLNLPPELQMNPANLNPFYVSDKGGDGEPPLTFKAPEGTQFLIKFSAIDPDGTETGYLVYSAAPLPAGATMDKKTGEFRWRPDFNQAGEYSIDISVSDENGGSDSLPINIIVTDFNHPPELGQIGDKLVEEGALLLFSLSATDEDGDQIRFKADQLPDGANLDSKSGTFRWSPSFSQAGEHQITFTVADARNATSSETIKITVEDVNRKPVILPPNWDTHQSSRDASSNDARWFVEGSEGAKVEFTIEAFDPEDGAVELRATNLPAGAAFDAIDNPPENELFRPSPPKQRQESEVEESNPSGPSASRTVGVFSWKPKYNQAGDYEITVLATDSISNVTSRRVFISIENTNRDPEILYPSKSVIVEMSVVEGEPLEFDIEAADPDGDRLVCTARPLPENASLLSEDTVEENLRGHLYRQSVRKQTDAVSRKAAGFIGEKGGEKENNTFAPSPFNSPVLPKFYRFSWRPTFQQAGHYEIDFTVSDTSGGSDSARAKITVLDYNNPPQFQPVAAVYIKPGEKASFLVSATDEEGDSFEYRLPNPPEDAIFYITSDDDGNNVVKFSWRPQLVGSYVVTFIAQDATSQSRLDVPIIVKTNQWDVNADNVVDILDLTLVARNFGAKVTTLKEAVCDVNGDGQIDIADFVLIGEHFGESYPSEAPAAPGKRKAESPPTIEDWAFSVSADGFLNEPASQFNHISAYITATESPLLYEQCRGFQTEVRWDSDSLELVEVESLFARGGQSGFSPQDGVFWLARRHEPGRVTLAAAVVGNKSLFDAHKAVRDELTIAKLTFVLKSTPQNVENSIILQYVKLVTLTPEGKIEGRSSERSPTSPISEGGKPEISHFPGKDKAGIHSSLHQNYPNPFNPDTWIPFQLSEDADVSITIYNVRGDLIRTLTLGDKAAGMYLSKSEAAYWDGRNDAGERVASGIYFYRIKSGRFEAVRKMMMTY